MSIETPDYSILPEHMRSGAKLWIEDGLATGSFLVAVLENNLKGACLSADSINQVRIFDVVRFFYSEAPMLCWGSPEAVKAWRERGGLKGITRDVLKGKEGLSDADG